MNPTPDLFDGMAFWESVKHKIWWRDIGYVECFNLMDICKRAIENNEKFWIQGPENIELTELYEQCKILRILKD